MKILDFIASVFVLLGGLNYGLMVFDYDVIDRLFGGGFASTMGYIIVCASMVYILLYGSYNIEGLLSRGSKKS